MALQHNFLRGPGNGPVSVSHDCILKTDSLQLLSKDTIRFLYVVGKCIQIDDPRALYLVGF